MQKLKKVVRRYKSKSGKIVEKVYEYDKERYSKKNTRKGKYLVTVDKNGVARVRRKQLDLEINNILSNSDYTDDQKNMLVNKLKDYVEMQKRNGKELTINGFWGHLAGDNNTIDRYFANMGYTTALAAEEIGAKLEDMRNEDNWVFRGAFGYYTDPKSNLTYQVIFSYKGTHLMYLVE